MTMAVEQQQELETGLQDCLACHRICLETLVFYVQQTDHPIEAAHVHMLLACADSCQSSADLLMLKAASHIYACAASAELCEACANLCAQKADSAQMKLCTETCRRCAESCYYLACLGGLELPTTHPAIPASSDPCEGQYDKVDHASELSFPASDPPGYLSDE
jgi:hypothetical protein